MAPFFGFRLKQKIVPLQAASRGKPFFFLDCEAFRFKTSKFGLFRAALVFSLSFGPVAPVWSLLLGPPREGRVLRAAFGRTNGAAPA